MHSRAISQTVYNTLPSKQILKDRKSGTTQKRGTTCNRQAMDAHNVSTTASPT